MVYHHDEGNSITQRLCWDEMNRLIATSDGSQISHYIYDANGERAMKYNGTLSKIQQNNYTLVDCANMGQFTYYINPLMTVSTQEYTKHYFIEGQRVMSRIGAGMANNLMDMEDGAYDYIMSALSDSIKNQLVASFECLSLDGIAVFNTSIEPILEMANENNHEFLRYFYHPDHLGSSSFITDATGEPTQHLEYLPFGELFIKERSIWNTPYKFSGKELDDETGYSYFGARYYDPSISIWLSVDPLADSFPSYSPFNYTLNNPLKLIDPDGQGPWDVVKGGLTTTGGAVMWAAGVTLVATGAGTPLGVVMIMGGSTTIGLGVAQIVDGAVNNGANDIPSGPGELMMTAADKVAGNVNGELRKYGALGDLGFSLVAGGIPKLTTTEGLVSTAVNANSAVSAYQQFRNANSTPQTETIPMKASKLNVIPALDYKLPPTPVDNL